MANPKTIPSWVVVQLLVDEAHSFMGEYNHYPTCSWYTREAMPRPGENWLRIKEDCTETATVMTWKSGTPFKVWCVNHAPKTTNRIEYTP